MKTERIKWLDEYIDHALQVACMEGHERALELLGKLLFEEPGYARLHNTLGIIYFRYADEPELAEMYFRYAIRFDPQLAEAYNLLAELLKQDERHDDLIAICMSGLKVKKTNKSLLLENVGNAWELKCKFGKAIRSYRRALRHSTELWNCMVLERSIKRCRRKQE